MIIEIFAAIGAITVGIVLLFVAISWKKEAMAHWLARHSRIFNRMFYGDETNIRAKVIRFTVAKGIVAEEGSDGYSYKFKIKPEIEVPKRSLSKETFE